VTQPEFHVVAFGATSFVGQILSRYLLSRHGAGGEFRWAIAGRSESKLKELREKLGVDATNLPIIVADAANEGALHVLCARTRVICSTVGPFALYGSALVKACAERGTDYCDITGESQWIARMIAAHEATARKSGARIVHCCGFDSIPSDLGVHFLHQQSLQQYAQPCTRVKLRIKYMRGYFSGGTMASLMNVVKEWVRDPAVRKLMSNPYALCPGQGPDGAKQHTVNLWAFDPDANSWLAPFIMATTNVHVVHRTNALSNFAYGREFVYDEAVMAGGGLKGRVRALAISAGLGGFLSALAFPPTRVLLENFVLPKPGQGPIPEQQEKGGYDFRLFGQTADGKTTRTKVTGDRDPGYGSTARMLGEAVACLALDIPKSQKTGGFWTPATVLGDRLMQRLIAHAGLKFEALSP
jgi:short subunit dehydrogenase-like uncharacterized protein